jgi:hypothetical protein
MLYLTPFALALPWQPPPCSITGVVLDSRGEPTAATVTLTSSEFRRAVVFETQDGTVFQAEIPCGTWKVHVESESAFSPVTFSRTSEVPSPPRATRPGTVMSEDFLDRVPTGPDYLNALGSNGTGMTPCIPYRHREGDAPVHVVYDCSIAFTESTTWPVVQGRTLESVVVMTPGMVPTTSGLKLHGESPTLMVDGHRL